MKYTIFYSWQSDLLNNKNRSFIEKCIERAIRTTSNSMEFEPYFDYDRDTKNATGSPDMGVQLISSRKCVYSPKENENGLQSKM